MVALSGTHSLKGMRDHGGVHLYRWCGSGSLYSRIWESPISWMSGWPLVGLGRFCYEPIAFSMIATRKMILDSGARRAVEQAEHVIDLFTEEKTAGHGGLHVSASIHQCPMERGYIWPSSPPARHEARYSGLTVLCLNGSCFNGFGSCRPERPVWTSLNVGQGVGRMCVRLTG